MYSFGTKIKTWHKNDPGFLFSPDNITLCPRAVIQINNSCPREYKLIIAECISNGWVESVAYQPVEEYFVEELSK
jgi:hypothetical protein